MEQAYVFDSYQLMSSVVPVFLIEIKTQRHKVKKSFKIMCMIVEWRDTDSNK